VELDAVADELYGLNPHEFTATRDARARDARAEGDPELAARIRDLRKPTLSAWAGNLLVRRQPDEVEPLLALGEELRRAHRELDGERLRELSRQQWRLLTALSRQAGQLAAEAGHSLGEQALREVEQTMKAVLADPEKAEEWAAGRLTRPLTAPSGFRTEERAEASPSAGVTDLEEARARRRKRQDGGRASEPAGDRAGSPREKAREKAREKSREKSWDRARQAREKAEAAEERAHAQDEELSAARQQSDEAGRRREQTDREVTRLTDRLHRAESEQHTALDDERRAQQRLRAADRAVRDARRAARDASRYADRLASDAGTETGTGTGTGDGTGTGTESRTHDGAGTGAGRKARKAREGGNGGNGGSRGDERKQSGRRRPSGERSTGRRGRR
jgi:hypothetical protein